LSGLFRAQKVEEVESGESLELGGGFGRFEYPLVKDERLKVGGLEVGAVLGAEGVLLFIALRRKTKGSINKILSHAIGLFRTRTPGKGKLERNSEYDWADHAAGR